MPTITRACPETHVPHASTAEPLRGYCAPCYEGGAFVLAVEPDGLRCVAHVDLNVGDVGGPGTTFRGRGARRPRGRAARRPAPPARHGRRPRTVRRDVARRVARAMAYGRRRAADRVAGPDYRPHPGWRHILDEGWRVITDQSEALARLDQLVDDEQWRTDKRSAWTAILRRLVCSMDWDTGLVAAVTAQRLGDAGARAPRTVSRVIAWAREVGLLVVVEHAASADFLGTDHGRTPTYALVTTQPGAVGGGQPAPHHPSPTTPDDGTSAQLSMAVDETGDPPVTHVCPKPLNGRRQPPARPAPPDWPLYGIPTSPAERSLATRLLIRRLGLDGGGVSQVPLWRARALLRPWWAAGASPAGLLHAIDHHPDHPTARLGDALRGARDPLRVLGHRLTPWRGRLTELPAAVHGLPGDYRTHPGTTRPATRPAPSHAATPDRPTNSTEGRLLARHAFAQHEAHRRASRRRGDSAAP